MLSDQQLKEGLASPGGPGGGPEEVGEFFRKKKHTEAVHVQLFSYSFKRIEPKHQPWPFFFRHPKKWTNLPLRLVRRHRGANPGSISLSLSLSKLSGRSSSTHRSPNVGLGASISLRPLGELDRAGGGTGPAPLRAQTSSNERNQLRSCDKRSWFRPPLPPVHWAVRALHGVLGANRWLEPNWLGDTGLAQWWARVDMSTDSLRE